MKHVEERQKRSAPRRHPEGVQDEANVQDCYERVDSLRRELQASL